MKQKVVIIGHGFTSRLSVIRAVGSIGCEVTVIVMTGYRKFTKILNTSKPIDCYSKYVKNIYYCYGKDKEGLIQTLIDKCTDQHQKVVIIPDSDFSAAVIDDAQERLKNSFLFPHVHHTPGAVRFWMNKENQKELAEKIGLNYAKSCSITITNGDYVLPSGIHYPCFTKPQITLKGGKQYFRRCNTKEELCALLDFVGTREDATILAEQYIDIHQEYALLGFSDGKEVVVPAIVKFIRNCKSHFGIAMQGQVMPTTGFENLINEFKQLVLETGFVGLFDIDFFWDGKTYYFGELNLRFGGSGYAVTKMGVNLPGMLVKSLCGESIADMPKAITGTATYVNERMCMDDWIYGHISTKEYEDIITSSNISFIKDDIDPGPQRFFSSSKRRVLSQLKKIYKKLSKI